MKSKSKNKLQSGAIVTFLNILFYKLIQLASFSEGVEDILVYLSTPFSLVLAWGIIIVVELFGHLKAEDILLNRETNKEIKAARKIINNPKSTSVDIENANTELKAFLKFKRENKVKQLKRLAKASEQAQSSTEFMKTAIIKK
jgi:hypothetical protein